MKNNKIVNFIICGTQKGGTTALDAYLREHSEICMANTKEVHFFDNEKDISHENPNYDNYHSYFSPKENHKIIGEATPIYMYWDNSIKRIHKYNPNMKIIIILRNPIDRAYSHWNMERSRNADKFSFWDALLNEQKRCIHALPQQHRVYSYMDRGFYLKQIQEIWRYFPKNQVKIIKNEELKKEPKETLNKICDFLCINRFHSIKVKNVHSRPYLSQMNKKEREYLESIFKMEIQKLELALQWDCSNWLSQ